MSKFLRSLWIVWLLITIANVLLINVYQKYIGIFDSSIRLLGYWEICLAGILLVCFWMIGNAKSRDRRGGVVIGSFLTAIVILAMGGLALYALRLSGDSVVLEYSQKWADIISFISF